MKWLGNHIWSWISRFRNDVYLEDLDISGETRVLVVDANGKVSINSNIGTSGSIKINYASVEAPQLFNPDSAAVTAGSDIYALASDASVALVTVNGQVLDDSEYSLAGSNLTVTPDNGFLDTSDEVLVFQHSFTTTGTGTEVVTNYSSLAAPQLFNPSSGAVTSGTAIFALAGVEEVSLVAINGILLRSFEYALAGSGLYVTPGAGFGDTSDEVLVFQNEFTSSDTGTVSTNNYISFSAPQTFNPDAAAVSTGTDTFTCSSEYRIALVVLNGQVLDDSEYSLAGSILTVTPDVGFADTADQVIVLQHSFSEVTVHSEPGSVVNYWVNKSADYTLTANDYGVDCSPSAPMNINLPTAVGVLGQEYVIANRGTSSVTVNPDGAETVGGAASQTLTTNQSIIIVSNDINWLVISSV